MNNPILAIDIGTTNIISIVASNDFNNKINILGVGQAQSSGVQKGNIVDINLASNAIKEAVAAAKNSSGAQITKAIVSLSGANTKTLGSIGSVNIPSGHISLNDIKQVLIMALYNAQVIADYEVIHVLPIYFQVDDGAYISNPLNMNGTRIEVSVNIITAKKTSLTNIRNTLKQLDLDVDKFVLTGYATSIAVLEDDQRDLGAVVINIGGSTTQFVVQKGSTIVYNDFIPIGSENITKDISQTFHTPYSAANMIKKQFATLLPISNDESNQSNIKKVKLPIRGNEAEMKEISIEQIQPVLHARIEEILCLVHDKLVESAAIESIDGGIVITGGMVFIPGIKELASLVFENIPVRIANPINIQNGYVNFNIPTMSTIAGLLYYELNCENSFELDSNGKLRVEGSDTKQVNQNISQSSTNNIQNENDIHNIQNITTINDEKSNSEKSLSGIFSKISRWL